MDGTRTTLVKAVQDIVMPLGLCLLHFCVDGSGEFIAEYYRDNCKTTTIVQQLSSTNTPEKNVISERDGRTIIDVARCMLNEAALPKSLCGKVAATASFLLDRLPNKTIGGDMSYYRMFGKYVGLSFPRPIGTSPYGGHQVHLSRRTRSPHHLQSQQQLRAH